MNVLEFVLLASAGVIVLTVGLDAAQQAWVEKRAERKAHWAKVREAETLLYAAISKRFEGHFKIESKTNVIELKVVELPKKPVGGRHRLTAA